MKERGTSTRTSANHTFERLLDSGQAAELMHLHPESVKRLARTGRIVAAKVGGVWRFRVSALEAYWREITQNTQSRITQTMAPSEPAVCAGRNGRKYTCFDGHDINKE